MKNYGYLKSGTDIRGRAVNTGDGLDITDEVVYDCTRAFLYWLKKRLPGKARIKIALGRDSRITGEAILNAALKALRTTDTDILECGLISTPAAFMFTQFKATDCDGSIMFTASHMPYDKNGLKFFTKDGGVNASELDEIISYAERGFAPPAGSSQVYRRDFLRWYCDDLCLLAKKRTGMSLPLRNMKIAVDAGCGAAGFFAKRVLAPLGADITCSQFLEPDGHFPAHAPNPEDKQAMDSLSKCVVDNKADLGVIFDADGDRSAIVLSDGREVNRSRLIAMAAAIALKDNPGATIVCDSVTTEELDDFITARGGTLKRFKRGYRNVIDEAKRIEREDKLIAPLAMETSGHAAFKENYFLDDGAYLVIRILVEYAKLKKEGKPLSALISDYVDPLEEADFRLNLIGPNWRKTAETILERLEGISDRLLKKSESYEGVRAYVAHADGFFTVRKSVHEPVIPIYIESNKEGGVASISRFLLSFLRGFRGVDVTELINATEQTI